MPKVTLNLVALVLVAFAIIVSLGPYAYVQSTHRFRVSDCEFLRLTLPVDLLQKPIFALSRADIVMTYVRGH